MEKIQKSRIAELLVTVRYFCFYFYFSTYA